jgi:pimeloyl-ACP methyl ester carboxylesterase
VSATATDLTGLPVVEGVDLEHRFVEANGLRMHVAEAGSGDPVVLLHGWPQHWWEWRGQIPALAERYRVICPDLRGFGWTDAPATGYEKPNLARDVLRLLDALGLDRVRLMGHDWGGWIGFLLCFGHPERVERFIALNIVPPLRRPTPRAMASAWRFWYQVVLASPRFGAWLLRTRPGFVRAMLRLSAVNRATWSGADLDVFAERLRQPERARARAQLYRTFLLKEFVPVATRGYSDVHLEVPTLLLFGTRDFAISRSFVDGLEHPNLEVELRDDSGHFIADELPELVAQRALEFFGRT